MEAICFSLNDFDLVIDPFDITGVDRITAVVDKAVTMTLNQF